MKPLMLGAHIKLSSPRALEAGRLKDFMISQAHAGKPGFAHLGDGRVVMIDRSEQRPPRFILLAFNFTLHRYVQLEITLPDEGYVLGLMAMMQKLCELPCVQLPAIIAIQSLELTNLPALRSGEIQLDWTAIKHAVQDSADAETMKAAFLQTNLGKVLLDCELLDVVETAAVVQ